MRLIGICALALVVGCSPAPTNETVEQPISSANAIEEASGPPKLWVTSQYLDRHTCPSEKCGIVGRLFFREAAIVEERKGEWARVSKVYDANCRNGVSQYVDKGRAACTAENGITDGQFAEWVKGANLSPERPPDPATTAAADEKIVANSDDFTQHRTAFAKAARQLISEGRCTAAEFQEMGGWVKSSNERDKPVYFTYCGGMTISNRLYLNAATGEIYQ